MNDATVSLTINGLTFSPELFSKGFPSGRGPCGCSSTCCRGGVYADLGERDVILAHKEMITKYLDETQLSDDTLWFEREESVDTDFPSGRSIGTTEHNGKCVFLDREGRCSLQVAAVQEGMDRWAIKPLFCILFPIEITNGVVSFDDLLQDEQPCCSIDEKFDVPMFRACREELTHLLGEEGYNALEAHYEKVYEPHRRPLAARVDR